MPQFDVHWKGIPHHHLPRIRVSSLDYGAGTSRHLAHIAALETCLKTYSPSFQRARLQQRSKIRRRRRESGNPRGHSTSLGRSARPTMSNTWQSGPGSPRFDPMSREERNQTLADSSASKKLSTFLPYISSDFINPVEAFKKTGIGGAFADNSLYLINESTPDQVVDLGIQREKDRQRMITTQQDGVKPDQFYSTSIVCKTNTASLLDRPLKRGNIRTYGQRIPLRNEHRYSISTLPKHDFVDNSPRKHLVQTRMTGEQPISSDLPKLQAIEASKSSLPMRSITKPLELFSLLPRNPTEGISLRNFKRGLERHLIAQEAVRKACLSHSSSLSSSILSANTVVELVPYIAEFNAAGLAVTSSEQRGASVLHPKDNKAKNQDQASTRTGMNIVEPIESHDGSSGGLYYSVTNTAGMPSAGIVSGKGKSTALASTNKNITSKKLRLPWLRKAPTSSSLARQIPADCTNTSTCTTSPSASTCETCASTVIDFTPQSVKGRTEQSDTKNQFTGIQPLDTKGSDIDGNSLMAAINEVTHPVVPERPVCAVSKEKSSPSALHVDSNHHIIQADAGSKSKRREKSPTQSIRQSHRLEPSIAQSTISATFSSPIRTSAKVYASQKVLFPHELSPVNLPQHTEPTMVKKSFIRSIPNRFPPPVPPKDPMSTSTKTSQLPDISIPHEYSYETQSIFEQALHDVINKSKWFQDQYTNEEKTVLHSSFNASANNGKCDPVKRKSASYRAHSLSPDELDATETSSLGFAPGRESKAILSKDHSNIPDKDVAKGLQVALAAAYNKELDLLVMESSGHRVRKFLSDLKAFEGLGVNDLKDRATQTARPRRGECYQSASGQGCDHVRLHDKVPVKQGSKRRNDQRRPVARDDLNARQGLLIAEMLHRRETRTGETVKERAIAMGWRTRSLSAGN